jgi:hypothetical protein
VHRADHLTTREPKPPGTLWATPGLLRDSFTFTVGYYIQSLFTVGYCHSYIHTVTIYCRLLLQLHIYNQSLFTPHFHFPIPLLFLIFINDLPKFVNLGKSFLFYLQMTLATYCPIKILLTLITILTLYLKF